MKLSDIKGERTLDVIAEIIEPIANIAADQTAAALFQRQRCPKGKKPKEFMLERVKNPLQLSSRGTGRILCSFWRRWLALRRRHTRRA